MRFVDTAVLKFGDLELDEIDEVIRLAGDSGHETCIIFRHLSDIIAMPHQSSGALDFGAARQDIGFRG